MNKQDEIWKRLSKHLKKDQKEFVLKTFSECFDYSPHIVWEKVIADVVNIMHQRERFFDKNTKVAQVKTKFGGLRFYIHGDDDYLRGAIKMAEIQCSRICPYCGSIGEEKVPTGRYVKRCVKCDEGSFQMT